MRMVLLGLFLLGTVTSGMAAPREAAGEQAGVASSDNIVQIRLRSQDRWVPCQVGDLLVPGDSIRTGDRSSASLLLSDQTMMRLGANTEVKLVSMTDSSGTLCEKFVVSVGRTWAKVTPGNNFQLHGPNAVAAVKGTVLEMDCSKKGVTRVNVWEGSVRCKPSHGEAVEIASLQSMVADHRGGHMEICAVDERDGWQRWNREFDRRLEVAFVEPPRRRGGEPVVETGPPEPVVETAPGGPPVLRPPVAPIAGAPYRKRIKLDRALLRRFQARSVPRRD